METLDKLIIEKAKHLTQKDAKSLYTLCKDIDHATLLSLSSVKTFNPTTITLLYWILPIWWIFNRFYTEQPNLGTFQSLFAFSVFPLTTMVKGLGILDMDKVLIADMTTLEFIDLYAGGGFFILVAWFLIDGVTMHHRVRRGNFRRLQKALK